MRTPTITDLDFYKNPDDMVEFFRRISDGDSKQKWWVREVINRRNRKEQEKPVGKVDVKL